LSGDLEELETACDQGNAEQIARVAHRLKGAAANVSAAGLREISSRLEDLGRSRRLAEATKCLEQLRRERRRIVDYSASLPRPLVTG
jgi:HPt (histidine-containing phosphotransfer) domain-containing protein